ncbi:MAG: efflux RND transporter periplasmic adaptor subunit, partial [Candidatus Ventricola sp.]
MSDTRKNKRRGRAGRAIGRWVKRLVLLAVVAAAGLFGLRAYIQSGTGNDDGEQTYSRAQVARGGMAETVYGTGTTSARNQPNLLAEADGTLTELRVSVGDEVREGDILAVLTNEDIDDTITDLEFDLWELDETITGTAAGSKVTTVLAPAAGRVMAVYAGVGDDALAVFRREGALAIISTDGRMKAELASNEHAFDLTLDETVRVVGEGIDETGTVVDLTQQGTRATITVLNDDLPMGASVTIKKESGEVVGETTLQVNKPMAVSSFGGTIKSVRAVVGEKINRRETMFTLEDPPLTLTLENLRLQRETAAKELSEAKAQRESLIIVAPCDGTVATLEVQEGDEITSGTLIGSILQGEDMNLTIAVDELDVVSVAAGQPVTITVDALSGLELAGE